jgi:hypothetical protein
MLRIYILKQPLTYSFLICHRMLRLILNTILECKNIILTQHESMYKPAPCVHNPPLFKLLQADCILNRNCLKIGFLFVNLALHQGSNDGGLFLPIPKVFNNRYRLRPPKLEANQISQIKNWISNFYSKLVSTCCDVGSENQEMTLKKKRYFSATKFALSSK